MIIEFCAGFNAIKLWILQARETRKTVIQANEIFIIRKFTYETNTVSWILQFFSSGNNFTSQGIYMVHYDNKWTWQWKFDVLVRGSAVGWTLSIDSNANWRCFSLTSTWNEVWWSWRCGRSPLDNERRQWLLKRITGNAIAFVSTIEQLANCIFGCHKFIHLESGNR